MSERNNSRSLLLTTNAEVIKLHTAEHAKSTIVSTELRTACSARLARLTGWKE
jgi:hypothetical protein